MSTRIIRITNLDSENTHIWGARLYQPLEEYTVPQEEFKYLEIDNHLYEDIVTIAQVSNGDTVYTDKVEAWNYIIGNYPQEVIPRAPKNEHNLRPLGMTHKHIDGSSQIFSISMQNVSGTLYEYQVSGTSLEYQDCITQNHAQVRDAVYEVLSEEPSVSGVSGLVDMHFGSLDDGVGCLCQYQSIDYLIPDTYATVYYLWGLYISAKDYGEDDIIRLQIVDTTGVGVALGYYTQEQFDYLGEVILKEYDECWVDQVQSLKHLVTPDGAPGELVAGLTIRANYYARDASKTNIRLWMDYIFTHKDA